LHVGEEIAILPQSYQPHPESTMTADETLTTTVSTKGQVILPKTIRQRKNWEPGTRLVVEDTPDGVLLKPAPVFALTRPEEVAGMLAYRGAPKTVEDMDAAITAEVRRRRARGRY
jgi:AbrB family looped-hinge helix DNA binding protein